MPPRTEVRAARPMLAPFVPFGQVKLPIQERAEQHLSPLPFGDRPADTQAWLRCVRSSFGLQETRWRVGVGPQGSESPYTASGRTVTCEYAGGVPFVSGSERAAERSFQWGAMCRE